MNTCINSALLILKLYKDIKAVSTDCWYKVDYRQGLYDSLNAMVRVKGIKNFNLASYYIISMDDKIYTLDNLGE